jgi:hypothetical protein
MFAVASAPLAPFTLMTPTMGAPAAAMPERILEPLPPLLELLLELLLLDELVLPPPPPLQPDTTSMTSMPRATNNLIVFFTAIPPYELELAIVFDSNFLGY